MNAQSFTKPKQPALHLSDATTDELVPEFVSEFSKWTDLIWVFKSPTPGQSLRVNWDFQLPRGLRSSDPQFGVLLQSFKVVMWGVLNHVGIARRRRKVGSVSILGVGMRELFRWMVLQTYTDFSKLDRSAQDTYLNDLPIILTEKRKFYTEAFEEEFEVNHQDFDQRWGETVKQAQRAAKRSRKNAEEDADDEGDTFTYEQVGLRIDTLYFIYAQSDNLFRVGLPKLSAEPFGGASAHTIKNTISTYVVNRIPPLPDEVANELLNSVIEWVEQKSFDVLELQKRYLATAGDRYVGKIFTSLERAKVEDALTAYEFQCLQGSQKPWRSNISTETIETRTRGDVTREPIQVLRNLVTIARAACVLCLQYLVGIRANEICSIEVKPGRGATLPSCVDTSFSKDGTMELFFVNGLLSKGVPHPIPEKWLLGVRPVGSEFVPIPVKAIIILYDLLEPWRQLCDTDKLLVSIIQKRGMPRSPEAVGDMLSATTARDTKDFFFSQVDLSRLPDISSRGEDLTIYRDTKGGCVRTRQGRKTYAAYLIEARSSFLRSVSQHFKHSNTFITADAYYPTSVRLREEINATQDAQTIAFFMEALDGKKIYGNAASYMDGLAEELTAVGAGLGNREACVRDMVKTHDLRIVFSDHGNCLIKLNPLASRCRAVGGGATWSTTTPSYSARTPNMCAGCGCFAYDRSHYNYWKRRADDLEKTLSGAAKDGLTHEFRALERKMIVAKNIVRNFERKDFDCL